MDDDADFGSHGAFGDRSHAGSLQWPLTAHRRGALLGAGLAAALGLRMRRG